jgi:uncharacterized membrane protein
MLSSSSESFSETYSYDDFSLSSASYFEFYCFSPSILKLFIVLSFDKENLGAIDKSLIFV